MGFKVKDHYFEKAKQDNYLARSAYKLEEINKKYKILKPGNKVFDLGYKAAKDQLELYEASEKRKND